MAGLPYGPLYEILPEFEPKTGLTVHVAARLPLPELIRHLDATCRAGAGPYDFICTHNAYTASQKDFLRPLDDWYRETELNEFIPSTLAMSRVEGWLLSIPRNLETRLLYYREDLFENPIEQERFRELHERELRVPETWEELAQIARFFTRPPGLFGYAFPGQGEGLFAWFYELLVAGGGILLQPNLTPGFADAAGRWALGFARRLCCEDKVTPPEVVEMDYDDVSQAFLVGRCAMVLDWPGAYYRYSEATQSQVAERFKVALCPSGPAGQRWAYAGGHAFAVPTSVRDEDGTRALLRFLTSADAQWIDVRHGSLPVLKSVQTRLREET
ncbi:MAG: extracellular solute-binding protein, partial [Acidobacteria bacterium]|nr:extracellular solute-binding protein [Acidobacteriota bacterium]